MASARARCPASFSITAPVTCARPPCFARLAAQATRGGTLFRELSLARTGHWLLGQPRAAAAAPAAAAAAASDPAAWLTTVAGADGPVTVIRPPGQLDGRELAWPSPLTGYGTDQPAWRLDPAR